MIRKQHKKYSRPRKLFEKARIDEENVLVSRYGLKNKKEIWLAESAVAKIRGQAKKLIISPAEIQDEFIARLIQKGYIKKNAKIDDVLDLKKENILDRRLQTVVFKKGFASTPKQARQMVVHKHITVEGKVVNIPSFQIPLELEDKVAKRIKVKKEKPSIEIKSEEKT